MCCMAFCLVTNMPASWQCIDRGCWIKILCCMAFCLVTNMPASWQCIDRGCWIKIVVNKIFAKWRVLFTRWGRVICVGKLTIIGSGDGLSPARHRAIIWTNAGILLIEPLGTKFSEISIEVHAFSFKKLQFKMLSGKWRPSCIGLKVLIFHQPFDKSYWVLYLQSLQYEAKDTK